MPAPFLRIARISHVFKGQGGAAPVIYKDFALLLGLDRAPGYDPWQINFRYILETSLARLLLTCLSFVHFLDWAFVRGVGRRHLHPWCSITTVLTMVFGARKGAICGLAIADPPCIYIYMYICPNMENIVWDYWENGFVALYMVVVKAPVRW